METIASPQKLDALTNRSHVKKYARENRSFVKDGSRRESALTMGLENLSATGRVVRLFPTESRGTARVGEVELRDEAVAILTPEIRQRVWRLARWTTRLRSTIIWSCRSGRA